MIRPGLGTGQAEEDISFAQQAAGDFLGRGSAFISDQDNLEIPETLGQQGLQSAFKDGRAAVRGDDDGKHGRNMHGHESVVGGGCQAACAGNPERRSSGHSSGWQAMLSRRT